MNYDTIGMVVVDINGNVVFGIIINGFNYKIFGYWNKMLIFVIFGFFVFEIFDKIIINFIIRYLRFIVFLWKMYN